MRSEKYSRSHNQEPSSTRKNDHWEETQLIFQNRDKIKEEVDYQKVYAERRARAAAYKEYLAARENPDGNRSPEEAARRTYAEEKVKRKEPILKANTDRDEARQERKQEKRRSRSAAAVSEEPQQRERKRSGRKSGGSGNSGGKFKLKKGKLTVVLLIVAVLLAGALLLGTSILGKVGKLDIDKDNLGIDTQVAEDLKGYRNIALLGVDARDMDDFSNCRTDAIIILSLDKKNNEIRQISVYRDTYVYVSEEYGYDKITNVHAYAGTEGTIRVLNQNLDLNIEEVVIVNWKAVAVGIDAIGGVEIEVLDSEVDELNKYINETATSIGGDNTKVESAGVQTLNGVQAVTYSRIRKDAATGDYRRNERMKIVVSAAVDQAKKHPFRAIHAANEALPLIKTNMSTVDLMTVMMAFLNSDMTGSTGWPFDTRGWTNYNGAWCGVPVTLEGNVSQLHEEYFAQPDYTPTEMVQNISATISSRTGYY